MTLHRLVLCLVVSLCASPAWAQSYYPPIGPGFFSQLVSQQLVPSEPLTPARVAFTNSSREPLIVWVFDTRTPGRGGEYRIPAGASVDLVLDRDSGGVLQQVYHVRRYLTGWTEQVVETPIPPRILYNVVAFAERTQLIYRDPKGISGVPDYDENNAVGIGVFEVPPGTALGENVRLDVAREAAARNNPGAVAAFSRPLPPTTDDPDAQGAAAQDARLDENGGRAPRRQVEAQPVSKPRPVHTVPQFSPRTTLGDDVEES